MLFINNQKLLKMKAVWGLSWSHKGLAGCRCPHAVMLCALRPKPACCPMTDFADDDTPAPIHEPRVWSDERWIAQVIKNEDDDGWAVSMTLHGESEPALVGPWTMGRDKKNPKPLDVNAFNTLVKTASEVLRRHEQQLDRKSVV